MTTVIGWDVGGAHLKAALIESGRVVRVMQQPCALWLGLDRLTDALAAMRLEIGEADAHAATMTGELADIFPDRRSGVAAIAAVLADAVSPLTLYGGRAGWLRASDGGDHADDIASANWHASAALAATRRGEALFVDVGSTTTDIVLIAGGVVRAAAYSDADRLACGELVYTGLTRSFVMALASRAPFDGGWTTLACEYFASSADIYRILGTLDETVDQMATADSRAKTQAASRARLARMIGRDAADASDEAWHALAEWFAEQQLRTIHDAVLLVLSRGGLRPDAPLIAAGIGTPIVRQLAHRLNRACIGFADLIDADKAGWTEACAPAIAVALLYAARP